MDHVYLFIIFTLEMITVAGYTVINECFCPSSLEGVSNTKQNGLDGLIRALQQSCNMSVMDSWLL
jgi:hypothetical protein